MLKSIFVVALTVLSVQGNAKSVTIPAPANDLAQALMQVVPLDVLLQWKVGDSADYNMSGGIINGTMHTFVREETAQGFWLQQDADLGFLGKQKVDVLYDKTNAKVLEMLVNDQKQTPPDPADTEIVETKHDHITVPKGEFDCIYVKIHDKKQNQDSEVWVNPKVVPINGMLKAASPSQFGTITLELTDFKRN